jgi:hypothetical protein
MTSKGAEKTQNDTIGVAISKYHLDAHRLSDGVSRRFANDKSGAMLELRTPPPRSDALLALKELHLPARSPGEGPHRRQEPQKGSYRVPAEASEYQRLEQIGRQMAAIEVAILEQIPANPDLAQRFEILTSIRASRP